MKKKASDYVRDCPVYVTCEPEETSLSYVTQVIGDAIKRSSASST